MSAEDLFQQLVEAVPVGIAIFRGPEFIVDMANETYLQIVDRPREAFVGKPLFGGLPEIRPVVEPLLNKVYQQGIPHYGTEFEVTLNRHGRREQTYFNFVYQPLREHHLITGIVVVANEVTQLTKRQKLVEERERKFRRMIDLSPIAMAIFRGEDLVIEMANRTILENIWRRRPSEVIGRPLAEAFPELTGQPFPALLAEVFRTGQSHRQKEALAHVAGNDGERAFFLDLEYSALRNNTGEVDGIMITVNDVTEKVKSRQSLEEAEERARLATDASLAGIFDIELPSLRVNCSARFFEIFGLPPGSSFPEITSRVHPDDAAIRTAAWELSLETGILFYEVRIITGDDRIRWIRAQGRLYRNDQGEPTRMLGTIVDFTPQKMFSAELEEKVRERTLQLEKANQELALRNQELLSFNYISSHDLQEPLRKIQTFASRITSTEATLSPENHVYFQRIQQSAKQMRMLIRDLLEYSRAGEGEKQFEPVDLGEVLATMVQQLLEEAADENVRIDIGEMPVIHAIPFQINQLFSNLLSNAVKFSRKKHQPIIRVEADRTADGHIIRVIDNGIGFLPEYKEHIFEVFRRLHHRSEYEGTGVGLAICKKIVENHSGTITAEGQPGEGATFSVWLPAKGSSGR
jgi:PAS domain S-box-containing protein